MKYAKIKMTALILGISLAMPNTIFAQTFADVPQDHWSATSVAKAQEFGLMNGRDDATFGFGDSVSKGEFITILYNMFDWEDTYINVPLPYTDVPENMWYYDYITAAYNQNVLEYGDSFAPESPMTRGEMAKIFVKALGLTEVAERKMSEATNFVDIANSVEKGYIIVANEIGMISGVSEMEFAPNVTATREECAAMLTRVYGKYYGETDFLHHFYAISSYSQKDMIADGDATTYLWGSMMMEDGEICLATDGENDAMFQVPAGYEEFLDEVSDMGQKRNFGVYMDGQSGVVEALSTGDNREAMVEAIVEELENQEEAVGFFPYSGITVDFEGLRGAEQKENLNVFLMELRDGLRDAVGDLDLYVMVQPALADGVYYDGYDYKTIGEIADKVILMAHDYEPQNLEGFVGTYWHENAPITPIDSVYYSLEAITDPVTGVEDLDKIVLAMSFAAVGWKVSDEGVLVDANPVFASSVTVYEKMQLAGTKEYFSMEYRNPYITYRNVDDTNVFLWYENEQSVFEKVALARLFGIDGVSIWRLGNIPDFDGYAVENGY